MRFRVAATVPKRYRHTRAQSCTARRVAPDDQIRAVTHHVGLVRALAQRCAVAAREIKALILGGDLVIACGFFKEDAR